MYRNFSWSSLLFLPCPFVKSLLERKWVEEFQHVSHKVIVEFSSLMLSAAKSLGFIPLLSTLICLSRRKKPVPPSPCRNLWSLGGLFPEACRHPGICVRRPLPSGDCIEMNVLPCLLHFQFCGPQSPGPKVTYWRSVCYINYGLEFGIFSVYYIFVDLEKLAIPCLFS